MEVQPGLQGPFPERGTLEAGFTMTPLPKIHLTQPRTSHLLHLAHLVQAPPWGRWLDWDTNGCLKFQRIGESVQRPLELCSWEGRELFEQPSSAWPVAKLQQLDQVHMQGDNNSLNANATKIITSITEYYRHPHRFISWWAKAVGVVAGGFSKEAQKHFPQLVLGRLDYSQPDREHKWRLPPNSVLRQDGWREEVVWHRGLLGLPAAWEAGVESIGKGGAGWLPIENRVRYVLFLNRSLEAWQTAPHAKPHGNSRRRRTAMRTCSLCQAVHEPVELPFLGRELKATSDYSPATHIAGGVDPGVTQAIKAAHAKRDPATGQVLRQWEWELTKGQLKHDSGLTKAKQDTARWSAAIQPQLQQLAVATPAGTTLDGLHAHILALKATWDPLWEEYLKPRWRRQRLALHHAQERVIEGFCKKHYHQERGVAVFLGAGNFSQGGWKAGAVRAGFRKVVEQPSSPRTAARPDRVVTVEEFRTSRALLAQDPPAPPPAQPPPPPAAQAQPPAQPPPGPVLRPQAPPWGRWLDRDINPCLNFQRIGESKQRPLELCHWKDLEALPPIGKEYLQAGQ
ncbi:hypothetical protein QJQ45_007867 [Haematococcus lacustris]|nr:hypothetical protein QJQ45_007867 [Haematococcus lacustris]